MGGFTNSRVRVFRNSRVKKCPEIIGDRRSPRWATLAKSSSAPPSRTAASRRRTGRAQRRAALRPPPRSRARPPRPSAAAGRRCTRAPAATRGRAARVLTVHTRELRATLIDSRNRDPYIRRCRGADAEYDGPDHKNVWCCERSLRAQPQKFWLQPRRTAVGRPGRPLSSSLVWLRAQLGPYGRVRVDPKISWPCSGPRASQSHCCRIRR